MLESVDLPHKVIEQAMVLTGKRTPRAALTALVKARKPSYPMDDGLPSQGVLDRIRRALPQKEYRPTRSLFKGL